MTDDLIDISMPLRPQIAVWPGSPGFRTSLFKSMEYGDGADATLLEMDVHVGTHVDSPAHTVPGAETMTDYALGSGVGDAVVVETGRVARIDGEVLSGLDIESGSRVLLKTRNSVDRPLHVHPFTSDYAALTADGAQWLVDRGVRLVGIDYLSIQLFDDPVETHNILFSGGVTVLEGLCLDRVAAGTYELICLPLPLTDREAAPARAVLRPRSTDS